MPNIIASGLRGAQNCSSREKICFASRKLKNKLASRRRFAFKDRDLTIYDRITWITGEIKSVLKGELKPDISLLHMKVLTLIKVKSNVFLWYVQCCSCTRRSKTKISTMGADIFDWVWRCDVTPSNAASWIWLVIVDFDVPAFNDLL